MGRGKEKENEKIIDGEMTTRARYCIHVDHLRSVL